MNTIAANELKRRGITAIEKLITKGPVHVIKRNKAVCVVLTEDQYERLVKDAKGAAPPQQLSVMEWLALPPLGQADKAELDNRLSREREVWDER